MSIYRSKNTPYYLYDFQFRGHRFSGSTKCKGRREAEAVEREEKEKAKQRITESENASTSLLLDHVKVRMRPLPSYSTTSSTAIGWKSVSITLIPIIHGAIYPDCLTISVQPNY